MRRWTPGQRSTSTRLALIVPGGSRAGTGPYLQLEAKVRKMAGQPEVRNTMTQARDAVQDKVNETAGKIGDALPSRQDTQSTLIN